MKVLLHALGSGMLFGVGLLMSGMTQPSKVVGFLDVTGQWDPSLALVMGGALLVYGVGFPLVLRRSAPMALPSFQLPTRTDLSAPLFGGAVLFGIGWAVAGFCPGPSLVAFGAGMTEALLFVPAMVGGMYLHRLLERRRPQQTSTGSELGGAE